MATMQGTLHVKHSGKAVGVISRQNRLLKTGVIIYSSGRYWKSNYFLYTKLRIILDSILKFRGILKKTISYGDYHEKTESFIPFLCWNDSGSRYRCL